MSSSPNTKVGGWRLLGRFFRIPSSTSPSSQSKDVKSKPTTESVTEDAAFSCSSDMMDGDSSSVDEDASASTTSLYQQMIADCLRGETFEVNDRLTDEENEEMRELKARTFINTLVAVTSTTTTTARGEEADDCTRQDESRPPHKGVKFAPTPDFVRGPGKEYNNNDNNNNGETSDRGEDEDDDWTRNYSDSESDSDSEVTTTLPLDATEAVDTNNRTPLPNIIEKIMLCSCPSHAHCLTCQMNDEAFSLVLKDSYTDLSPAPSARWVIALSSLDRAVRMWVGEHVTTIAGGTDDRDAWQTPTKNLDAATLTAIRDMINIAQGIGHLRDRRSRYICNALRKTVKFSDKLKEVKQKLLNLRTTDPERTKQILSGKFVALKKEIEARLNSAIDLLGRLNNDIKLVLARLARIRGDMLRNFEQSNTHWPRSSLRKIEFMAEVLVHVYNDSRQLAASLRGMFTVWEKKLGGGRAGDWWSRIRGFLDVWEEWHFDVRRGLDQLTRRAAVVIDRRSEFSEECPEEGCSTSRRIRRVKKRLLPQPVGEYDLFALSS